MNISVGARRLVAATAPLRRAPRNGAKPKTSSPAKVMGATHLARPSREPVERDQPEAGGGVEEDGRVAPGQVPAPCDDLDVEDEQLRA
jgi:hypothetical protein